MLAKGWWWGDKKGQGVGGWAGVGLSLPRLSPALKWSVFPPLSPSLRAAGPRSGN